MCSLKSESQKAGDALKPSIQFIMNESGTIPSLPTIYLEIKAAVDDPRATSESISDLIAQDHGLTACLMKLSNSAFYGFASKVDTIFEGVSKIGIKQIRDLALATTVMDMFKGLPEDLVNMRSFWEHSMGCGVGSRVLSGLVKVPSPERLFVGGLLHDIGRLAMYLAIPNEAREVIQRVNETGEYDLKVEQELLGFDHAELGSALLRSWQIPPGIVEMVQFHHRPGTAQLAPQEVALIHLSDVIISGLGIGSSGEHFVPPFSDEAWEKSKLKPGELPEIIDEFQEKYAEIAELLL